MPTPFRTRVSTFDRIGPVWSAVLNPCTRCSEHGRPPIVHVVALDGEPSPDGGEVEIEAPCTRSRSWIDYTARTWADAGRMILEWTAEQVGAAATINPTYPDPNAPRRNHTANSISTGEYL